MDEIKITPEMIRLVNSLPEMQSLLYDLDLLPEQIMAQAKNEITPGLVAAYNRFLIIASHFYAIATRMQNDFLNFNESLEKSNIDISDRAFKVLLEEMKLNQQQIKQLNDEGLKSNADAHQKQEYTKKQSRLISRRIILQCVFDDYIYNGVDILISKLSR